MLCSQAHLSISWGRRSHPHSLPSGERVFAFQTVPCLHFFLHPLLNPQQSSCIEEKPMVYRLSCPSEKLAFFFSQQDLVGGLELLKSVVLILLISKLRLIGNLPQVRKNLEYQKKNTNTEPLRSFGHACESRDRWSSVSPRPTRDTHNETLFPQTNKQTNI